MSVNEVDQTPHPGLYGADKIAESLALADHSERIDALNALAQDLRSSDPHRALDLSLRARDMATQGPFADVPYRKGLADSLLNLGRIQGQIGSHAEALGYLFEALGHYQAIEDRRGEGFCLNAMGAIHLLSGNYPEALRALQEAGLIFEAVKDEEWQAVTLSNLAFLYLELQEPQSALNYAERSLSLARQIEHIRLQADALGHLCGAHSALGRQEDALSCGLESIQLYRSIGARQGEATALTHVGQVHYASAAYDQALSYFEQSLRLAREIELRFETVEALLWIGRVYCRLDRTYTALFHLHEALRVAHMIEARQLIYECHRGLAEVYEQAGDYRMALMHFEQFHDAEKAVFNERADNRRQMLEVSYQVQAAEREAEIYQLRNVELEREIAERERVESRLRHYVETLRILHELDQSILAARSPESIAAAAVGRIRNLAACERVAVIAIDYDHDRLDILAADAGGDTALRMDVEAYREILKTPALLAGHPHGIEDLTLLGRPTPLQQALIEVGIRSFVILPLYVRGELLGTLHLESRHPGAFSEASVTMAAEAAALLALAMQQARLYEMAQQELVERKQAEAALRERTEELETRNAELDAFAHTVAHDLKSPLTGLIGFTDLLRTRYADLSESTMRQAVEMISASGEKMASIVDELLLLASVRRLEEVPLTPLNMADIIHAACQRLTHLVHATQAEIIVAPDWPVALGYAPWIEEVWMNYLSNALKYGGTPPRVELGAMVYDHETCRFWVRDNGNGLTDEQQAHLFSTYTRLEPTRADGHGLGLSIVQRIITRLGGEVGVESELGKGSLFYFTLPMPRT